MSPLAPVLLQEVLLQDKYVALEPLQLEHAAALEAAAADGELWNLWFTSVPPPGQMLSYIEKALQGQAGGAMLPFAIRETSSNEIVGTTRYYDFVAELPRLAIGYTWYAKRWQKSHLNTACKRLLFRHAFESQGCVAVEIHTDSRNLDSQRAIERLGARREGVLRAHKRRPDGSLRDTVCYSVLATEWADVDRWLDMRLTRLVQPPAP
ncbi:MAG: GNAT family protein [Rhodanobacter sp.]